MASAISRFDGAVHDEAAVEVGTNRYSEEVVCLDLTYTRGTAASATTMILTVGAARALRNQLNGLIEDEKVDDDALVDAAHACPRCSERNQDALVWQDDETIHCTNCGTRFALPAKA